MTETIGTCDVCGATDHHLVEGLCPTCQPKTITIDMDARARSFSLYDPCSPPPELFYFGCNGDRLYRR